jgi:hypothetical protein
MATLRFAGSFLESGPMNKSLAISAAILALSACSTTLTSPDQVQNATQMKIDSYRGTRTFQSPKVDLDGVGSYFNAAFAFGWLVEQKSTSGSSYWVQVYYDGAQWRFFNDARDHEQTVLPVSVINRSVQSGGSVVEEISIAVDRPYLEKHANSGVDIKLYGQNGTIPVVIPSHYIQGFLKAAPQ